jgi:hypothetical protein
MSAKPFKVHFTRSSIGDDGKGKLGQSLAAWFASHGAHLPKWQLESEWYQVRDLKLVGEVWMGTFAHLRPDAPHVVDEGDREREILLGPQDHVLDKCHFIYRSSSDVLVWQVSRSAGSLTKLAQYLSELGGTIANLPYICDLERLEQILGGQVYEIQFSYARPLVKQESAPQWTNRIFDTLSDVHGARAQVRLTAERRGALSDRAKQWIHSMIGGPGFEHVKVRLSDETSLVDLVMAPMKERIQVPLIGRYPAPGQVFVELEAAYDRKREQIQRQSDTGDF